MKSLQRSLRDCLAIAQVARSRTHCACSGYAIPRSGSHLRLTTPRGGQHHVTIPDHESLRTGTLGSILAEVARPLNVERATLVAELSDTQWCAQYTRRDVAIDKFQHLKLRAPEAIASHEAPSSARQKVHRYNRHPIFQ